MNSLHVDSDSVLIRAKTIHVHVCPKFVLPGSLCKYLMYMYLPKAVQRCMYMYYTSYVLYLETIDHHCVRR